MKIHSQSISAPRLAAGLLALALAGCTKYGSGSEAVDIFLEREKIPDSWQSGKPAPTAAVANPSAQGAGDAAEGASGEDESEKAVAIPRLPLAEDELLSWLYQLDNPHIVALVERGLDRNFDLARSWFQLEGLRHIARIEGSGLYPQLSLSIGAQRTRRSIDAPENTVSGAVNLQWEIDFLGRMANERRAASLRYLAAFQAHRQSQLSLAADIAQGWYTLEELQRIVDTETRSLRNLEESLEILEQGFRDGIVNSLDVLLARNDVAQQRVVLGEQRSELSRQARALQLLLGLYPDGRLRTEEPEGGSEWLQTMAIPVGMPADLLRRRPDLNAAWYEVLAADFELAAASKARFPRLTLTGSYGGSSSSLSRLVEVSFTPWSLGVSLLQNIFDGGRNRALYLKGKTDLAATEQLWLQRVYSAFTDIERQLTIHRTQQWQLRSRRTALASSEEAYTLAQEQYTNGTTSYTSVLQAQRRVLAARSGVIRNEARLRRNRIEMFRALGGGWSETEASPDGDGEDAAGEPGAIEGSVPAIAASAAVEGGDPASASGSALEAADKPRGAGASEGIAPRDF